MNGERAAPRRASVGRVLKRGIRDAYDSLGWVVLVSFVSFIVFSAMLSLGFVAARAVGGGLLLIPMCVPALLAGWLCATGAFYYAGRTVYHHRPVLADTWRGIRVLLRPALALFAVNLVIGTVLMGDLVFFGASTASVGREMASLQQQLQTGALSEAQNQHLAGLNRAYLISLALTVLFGYLSAVWGMIAMYHLPLMTAQLDLESGPRPSVILRKSVLLAFGSPGFTVAVFLAIIALAVLSALPALIGSAVLFLGVCAFLLTHALRELFIQYEVIEEEPEAIEDARWSLPESWRRRPDTDSTDSEAQDGRPDWPNIGTTGD